MGAKGSSWAEERSIFHPGRDRLDHAVRCSGSKQLSHLYDSLPQLKYKFRQFCNERGQLLIFYRQLRFHCWGGRDFDVVFVSYS